MPPAPGTRSSDEHGILFDRRDAKATLTWVWRGAVILIGSLLVFIYNDHRNTFTERLAKVEAKSETHDLDGAATRLRFAGIEYEIKGAKEAMERIEKKVDQVLEADRRAAARVR